MKRYICLFGFLLCLLAGCEEENCVQDLDTSMILEISVQDESITENTFLDELVMIANEINDTILYAETGESGTIEVPLDPSSDTTIFLIYSKGYNTDTLKFLYNRKLHLVSAECGVVNYFYNIEIQNTYQVIDSIETVNNSATINNDKNFIIYF